MDALTKNIEELKAKEKKNGRIVSFWVCEALEKRLNASAVAKGCTRSLLIRSAVEQMLAEIEGA